MDGGSYSFLNIKSMLFKSCNFTCCKFQPAKKKFIITTQRSFTRGIVRVWRVHKKSSMETTRDPKNLYLVANIMSVDDLPPPDITMYSIVNVSHLLKPLINAQQRLEARGTGIICNILASPPHSHGQQSFCRSRMENGILIYTKHV